VEQGLLAVVRMTDALDTNVRDERDRCREDRRRFCAALVVIGASACSSSPGTSTALDDLAGVDLTGTTSACSAGTSAGPAADIVEGTPHYVSSANVYVCRDAGGLYAVSARCTHQGCTVSADASGFSCPCHGATFDLNGQHPTSPASAALPHYALCVDASGDAQIDKSKSVDPSTRA